MQLVPRYPSPELVIDWWLMNHSRYQPPYWHPILYQGNISLPQLDHCLGFLAQAQAQGRPLRVKFTGGEVTEWSGFDLLIKAARAQGIYTEFRSHAQISREQWQTLMQSSGSVNMDYHPGFASPAVFLGNLDVACDLGVTVSVTLNMTKGSWPELIDLEQTIQRRRPEVQVQRHIVFMDPVFNTEPQDYTPEQLAQLRDQTLDLCLGSELTDYATLVLESRNRFQGWQCHAGLDQCVVDAWGRVYRSHCRHRGYMGKISDPQITWPSEPVICGLDQCVNAFDIRAIKIQQTAHE